VARLPLRPGEGGAGRVEITDSLRQVQIWTGPH
jgi:hypothetical protein